MIFCENCGQLFIVEMNSCPVCDKQKKNTEEAKNKLTALLKKLHQSDTTPEFKKLLTTIERML